MKLSKAGQVLKGPFFPNKRSEGASFCLPPPRQRTPLWLLYSHVGEGGTIVHLLRQTFRLRVRISWRSGIVELLLFLFLEPFLSSPAGFFFSLISRVSSFWTDSRAGALNCLRELQSTQSPERQLSPPHSTYTSRKASWQWGARQVKRVVLTSRKPPLFRCHRWQEPLPLRARSIYWYCVTQQSNSNLPIFHRQHPPSTPHHHHLPNLALNRPFVFAEERERQRKDDVYFSNASPLRTLSVILDKSNYAWHFTNCCYLFSFFFRSSSF